jgi:hypothetical protein
MDCNMTQTPIAADQKRIIYLTTGTIEVDPVLSVASATVDRERLSPTGAEERSDSQTRHSWLSVE